MADKLRLLLMHTMRAAMGLPLTRGQSGKVFRSLAMT